MASVSGAASLHEQVDQMVAKRAGNKAVAPAADDAEFFRRVSLDFGGAIPTADEARTFLADKAPDKRAKLIERLLAAPEFGDRMAEVFHIQLMERLGDDEKWKAYLADSFRANKPWDVMVREMISPDFRDEKLRSAGYFMTRRMEKVGQQETDYPGLTRDVGRLFMGVDLQCCQCHKHLTVQEYKQVDFNGLFFAISNTKLREPTGSHETSWR